MNLWWLLEWYAYCDCHVLKCCNICGSVSELMSMMVTIDVNDYIASAAEEIGRDQMSTGVVS